MTLTQINKPQSVDTFDEKTREFLAALEKQSTKDIYKSGLKVFQKFYEGYGNGTIAEFLNRLDEDLLLPPGKRQRVATNTLREFILYMKSPDGRQSFSPKTINCYVSSIRSLVSYLYDYEYKIPIRGIGLPNPEVISKKNPWTRELISDFLRPMKPMYKALGACVFQSGQGLKEILSLTFGDIQTEYESNIRPLMLTLRRQKTGVQYVSFLGTSSLNLLSEYFKAEDTPKSQERLFPVAPETVERYFSRRAYKLLKSKKNKQSPCEQVITSKLWVGNCPMRPHTLRSAFEKLLIKGRVPEIYAEYLMGHEISKLRDAYIISGMSPEEWRQEYRNFEKYLKLEL